MKLLKFIGRHMSGGAWGELATLVRDVHPDQLTLAEATSHYGDKLYAGSE